MTEQLALLAKHAPQAFLEIEAHRRESRGWSEGGGIAARGARWPVLSDVAAAELVSIYKEGSLARKQLTEARYKVTLTRKAELGELAAEALCGSMFRLNLQICSNYRHHRRVDREDLLASATLAVLDAADHYGSNVQESFSAWAAAFVRRAVKKEVESSQVSMPASWRKVGNAAWGVKKEYEAAGVALTDSELSEIVRRRLGDNVRENLREKELAGSRMLPGGVVRDLFEEAEEFEGAAEALTAVIGASSGSSGDIDVAVDESLVEKALVKQGVSGAVGKIGYMMAGVQTLDSLDRPLSETTGRTVAEKHERTLATTPSFPYDELGYEELLTSLTLGPQGSLREAAKEYLSEPEQTYSELAERYDVDVRLLRRKVRDAKERALEPHAQYAHLAPDAGTQIIVKEELGDRRQVWLESHISNQADTPRAQ